MSCLGRELGSVSSDVAGAGDVLVAGVRAVVVVVTTSCSRVVAISMEKSSGSPCSAGHAH